MTAGSALQQLVVTALAQIEGLCVFDGPPLQAPVPYAVVDTGLEADWSFKGGSGREVRVAVTTWDKGEKPNRLQALTGEIETRLSSIGGDIEGWRIVTLQFIRTRWARENRGPWASVVEFRARMLKLV